MQKRHLAAGVIFIALAIAMTWPLAARLTHAVADPSDPFINIWILDWDYHATAHHPLSLFDANVFYPERDTLAYSENLYGIAILLMPLRVLRLGPVTVYNIAMLLGFAFSGFAAYLLGVRLTGSFAAGLAAGIFHAFVPFRFTHLPHLQHVFAGWVPLLIVALLNYIDRPSWRSAALFAFVFLMNGLTNVHWMLFGSFAIGATALVFLLSGIRRWRELIVATAIAFVLLVPFLVPYARVAKTMSRSWMETKHYSATLGDWFVKSSEPERRLFPGFIALVVAAPALLLLKRYPRGVTFGLLWTLIGVLGSLGLNFYFHQFLFDAVPGFRGIRVPARWAEIAYIGMSMLIAVSVAFVATRWRYVAAIAPLLFLIELRAAPIRWYRAPVEVPDVYKWLATQDIRAAIELPIDTLRDYEYEFRATVHHKNIVNGASGLLPHFYYRISELSRSHPIPDEFTDDLRRAGVDLMIVHMDALAPKDPIRDYLHVEMQRKRLFKVAVFPSMGANGDWVFSLKPRTEERGPRTEWTSGEFSRPPALQGKAFFSGRVFSPFGVRSVDLLFEDGRVRVPAAVLREKNLFARELPKRPDGVPEHTDVQAEITDGRGEKIRLQYYWIDWR